MKTLTLLKFLFTVLFISFYFIGFAQLKGIGVNGGGSSSSFEHGNQVKQINNFDTDSQQGGTGGIKLDFYLGESDVFSFSPEIFLVENGSDEYYKDLSILQNDLIKRNVSLNYIGLYLPVAMYVAIDEVFSNGEYVTDYNYHGIIVQGKLFADYVIGGEISERGTNTGTRLGTKEVNFEKPADKFDFGFSVEAGLAYMGWTIIFGYNWGVKNIKFENALGYSRSSTDYLVNNKGLTLQMGYLLYTD